MLTAFNYYEPEEENRIQKGMKENIYFDKEVDIAKRYTGGIVADAETKSKNCPICVDGTLLPFYKKWGVSYLRCENCHSVIANVKSVHTHEYQKCDELVQLRMSEEYQKDGENTRCKRWEELIDWIKFRSFRYMNKNTQLKVLDYGTKWKGLIELLQDSDLCGLYKLEKSIYTEIGDDAYKNIHYDIILALDYLQHETDPNEFLQEVYNQLDEKGLFILNTKVGSGIDILALRENNKNVFPYEHVMLPSKEGIKHLLANNGFEMLEFTTPGTFDVNFLKNNVNDIAETDYFLRYFLETSTPGGDADFQHFIQKNGLSSYAQVIARKTSKKENNE